jgi:hypothetical protein
MTTVILRRGPGRSSAGRPNRIHSLAGYPVPMVTDATAYGALFPPANTLDVSPDLRSWQVKTMSSRWVET